MKDQDGFEDFVRTAINELDPLPSVPREEMWSRIESARRFRRRPVRTLPAWTRWGAALAAMLVLGIAVGRFSVLRQTESASPALTQNGSPETNGNTGAPYRIAALQHLSNAEVLLTSVSSGSVDQQVIGWARDMLTTTRLMLDSPAASDPRMAHLLQDLELLLAQVAGATANANDTELEIIQHGIQHTDVLPRLRATLPRNTNAAGT